MMKACLVDIVSAHDFGFNVSQRIFHPRRIQAKLGQQRLGRRPVFIDIDGHNFYFLSFVLRR